ncbi:MAG: hypothetical protein QXF61_11470 [Nitrososphaeria archaeon]
MRTRHQSEPEAKKVKHFSVREAEKVIGELCDRFRGYGIEIREFFTEDGLQVFWMKKGESITMKVYHVPCGSKELDLVKRELSHILDLVLQADRLISQGYNKRFILDLLQMAIKTEGEVSFIDRDGQVEVYKGDRLIKVYSAEELTKSTTVFLDFSW